MQHVDDSDGKAAGVAHAERGDFAGDAKGLLGRDGGGAKDRARRQAHPRRYREVRAGHTSAQQF
jgi:hypothetical protein